MAVPLVFSLLVMVVGIATHTTACAATLLSVTIPSEGGGEGSYSASDVTIPPDGTQLNMQDMLSNAAASNLTEAVFDLDRAVFEGTLAINLPTTVSEWATHNTPLRILIRNGRSSFDSWPITYIQITGVLGLGSNITIHGGFYHYTNHFVAFPKGIAIQDDSFLSIQEGSFRAHYPSTTTGGLRATTLVSCNEGHSLTLSNRSTFSISHNTFIIADVFVGSGDWWLQTLYMEQSHLAIGFESTLSISNNAVRATDVSITGSWYWFGFHTLRGGSINIASNSTLSISSSNIFVSDVTIGDEWWCYTLFTQDASIMVSHGSTFAITHNVLAIEKVDVRSFFYLYELHAIKTPITVHTNSVLMISDTFTSLTAVKAGYLSWLMYFPADRPTSSTTIHTNSTLDISNNNAVASTVTVGDTISRCLVYVKHSPFTLSSSSAISIVNNSMAITEVTVTSNNLWWYVLHTIDTPLIVTDNSTITITDVSMIGTNMKIGLALHWSIFYTAFSPTDYTFTLSQSSTLSISNVHMNAIDATIGSEGLNWRIMYSKSARTAISDSSTISITNNSLTVSNVNSYIGGTVWHPMYGTNSPFTLTTGGRLIIAENTLVKTTSSSIIGPLTENSVWMSGDSTQSWLGVGNTTPTGAQTCEAPSRCSGSIGVQSGLFSCSSGSDDVVFDCTYMYIPSSSPSPAPTTQSPSPPTSPNTGSFPDNSNDNAADDDDGLSGWGFIAVIVVGTTIGAFIVFGISYCCCYLFVRPMTATTPVVGTEMAATTQMPNLQQQQPHPVDIHNMTVVGVPVTVDPLLHVPTVSTAATQNHEHLPSPYGGGGEYQY